MDEERRQDINQEQNPINAQEASVPAKAEQTPANDPEQGNPMMTQYNQPTAQQYQNVAQQNSGAPRSQYPPNVGNNTISHQQTSSYQQWYANPMPAQQAPKKKKKNGNCGAFNYRGSFSFYRQKIGLGGEQ